MTDEQDDVARDADEARALRALETAERLPVPKDFAASVMQAVRERSPGAGPTFWTAPCIGRQQPRVLVAGKATTAEWR